MKDFFLPKGRQKEKGLFGLMDQHQLGILSLDQKLAPRPESTYYIRMNSSAMSPQINKGDILVVDRSLHLTSGLIGVFYYQGRMLCRHYVMNKHNLTCELCAYHRDFKNLVLSVQDDEVLEVFGVVRAVVREFFST